MEPAPRDAAAGALRYMRLLLAASAPSLATAARCYASTAMTTETKLLTAEEFMLLPEPPEGGKMELLYGEVHTMAPVGMEHSEAAGELILRLRSFARKHGVGRVGGELGFLLSREPDVLYAPDIYFVRASRVDAVPQGYFPGAPDLAVEVVSPSDSATAIESKVANYLRHGAERVWVVHPGLRSVTVHRPGGDAHTYTEGDTLTSADAAFPVEGFELPVSEIFA
jgi:Uma2 family endonuclease